jgi:hypothetical protein
MKKSNVHDKCAWLSRIVLDSKKEFQFFIFFRKKSSLARTNTSSIIEISKFFLNQQNLLYKSVWCRQTKKKVPKEWNIFLKAFYDYTILFCVWNFGLTFEFDSNELDRYKMIATISRQDLFFEELSMKNEIRSKSRNRCN